MAVSHVDWMYSADINGRVLHMWTVDSETNLHVPVSEKG